MLAQTSHAATTLSESDIAVLTTEDNWLPEQFTQIKTAFEECIFGAALKMGFQKCLMPAEAIASGIVVAVHPNNWLVACNLLTDLTQARILEVMGHEQQAEPVTREVLIGMLYAAGQRYPAIVETITNKLRAGQKDPLLEETS
jgi:hypothetical protein